MRTVYCDTGEYEGAHYKLVAQAGDHFGEKQRHITVCVDQSKYERGRVPEISTVVDAEPLEGSPKVDVTFLGYTIQEAFEPLPAEEHVERALNTFKERVDEYNEMLAAAAPGDSR